MFFLICSTDVRGHLRTLARLSRLLTDAAFLEGIRLAHDAADVHARITARERELFGLPELMMPGMGCTVVAAFARTRALPEPTRVLANAATGG